MAEIPYEVLDLISRAHRNDEYYGSYDYIPMEITDFNAEDELGKLRKRIIKTCHIKMIHSWDINHNSCFDIELSTKPDIPLIRSNKMPIVDFLKKFNDTVIEINFSLSVLGPYITQLKWLKFELSGDESKRLDYNDPPNSDCESLLIQIREIFEELNLIELSVEILKTEVPNMKGTTYTGHKPTVFSCLFHDGIPL